MSSLAVLKHYTERAVQTDLAITSPSGPGFTIDISDTSTCFLPALKAISPPETELPDIPAKSSAYMRSEHIPSEDTLEILASRKDRKLSPLTSGLGHPSTCVIKTERIVSLPECSSSSDVVHLAMAEKQKRVVSMPERGKLSNIVSVSEIAGTNADFGTGNMTRFYPSDVPQTPSPPSSPDSVMIIGNEEQVSGSFLQGRRRSFVTEDGWVTWASSPPRPIPALHGPLSLPYARCPSGAEGTVVEGDDLSHKVWGLGTDDTPAHARYHRTMSHAAPQPIPAGRSPEIKVHILEDQHQASSHQRRRDIVIDLSQPSAFDHIQDVARHHLRSSANTATQDPISKRSSNLPDLTASALAKLAILPHVRQQDHRDAPKKTCVAEAATNDQLGLALQWESLFNSDPKAKAWMNGPKSLGTGQGLSNRLNTSAPPFVPQNYASRILVDRAILQDKPQNTRLKSAQKLGNLSLNAAPVTYTLQDHNAQSPPSTVSPLWTPIFTQTADMHHGHGKSFGPKASRQMLDVYSPDIDRGGYQYDLANMHTISQVQNYDLQSLDHGHGSNKEKYLSQTPSLGNSYSHQDSGRLRDERPPIDIHQERSPVLFDTSNHTHGTSTVIMDRRRSLTQQHPRSIPLARLIQRRLSSVVEEESFTNPYSDLKAPPSTGGFLRPLPSGAPIRLLPVSSSEPVRGACSSSSGFTPRAKPRIVDNTHTDATEARTVFRSGAVPETSSTKVTASMMGSGEEKLQQINVKEGQSDSKAAKLPGPRVDSTPKATSNRSGGDRIATATTQKEHAQVKPSQREDASNVGEKENASVKDASAGRTPKKHNYKHKKRMERAPAASSKADRPT